MPSGLKSNNFSAKTLSHDRKTTTKLYWLNSKFSKFNFITIIFYSCFEIVVSWLLPSRLSQFDFSQLQLLQPKYLHLYHALSWIYVFLLLLVTNSSKGDLLSLNTHSFGLWKFRWILTGFQKWGTRLRKGDGSWNGVWYSVSYRKILKLYIAVFSLRFVCDFIINIFQEELCFFYP